MVVKLDVVFRILLMIQRCNVAGLIVVNAVDHVD